MTENSKNPWTIEDERDHFPSVIEWWCPEVFFKTMDDNKKWSLNASFTYGYGNSKNNFISMFKMALFDQNKNTYFEYLDKMDKPLLMSKSIDGGFEIKYNKSFIKGSFPDYEMSFNDTKNNILIDLNFHAKSMPHWVAQDITNGRLPLGLSYYKYGFIPKLDVTGNIKLDDKTSKLKGIGYFEHVWGDSSFVNPFTHLSGLKETISTYTKFAGWWIHNNKVKIPKTIAFTSENNPIGYDWIWAVLDNGWTIFYGNLMFWVMKGPAAGVLILSKDDINYAEFGNMTFRYNKIKYAKELDFSYPSEIELHAAKGKEQLHLTFSMTQEPREYISRYSSGKYWLGLSICEAPGEVKGYYYDGDKKIDLKGFCKIEPQRKISRFGHNSIKLDFLLPPDGFGISADVDSHYIKKKISTHIQLIPRPKFRFIIKNTSQSKIENKKKVD